MTYFSIFLSWGGAVRYRVLEKYRTFGLYFFLFPGFNPYELYVDLALMVEFVNNREETIAKGVAKAIARYGDGVHDVRVKCPL